MITIKEAKNKEDVLQAIFLRREVLVDEGRYSIDRSEPDKDDITSRIYVAKERGKVIGTARVREEKGIYRIQRMAVSKSKRRDGIGSRIIKRIQKDYPGKKIYLMAPASTIPFYERFGFKKTAMIQKGKFYTYHRMQNY